MSHSSTDAADSSRFTIHRFLDVLMQVAGSWTAFVNLASRQGQIRAASSLAGLIFVSNPYPKASLKSVRVWTVRPLRLGCWRRAAERFRRRDAGAGGSSGATKPSSQRKRHATACFSSRNERARSRVNARAPGAITARSVRWFRRVSGDAGTVKSAPDEMTNQKADATRGQ
jgi:hypothetical protein